jgi:hypothetical protein
VINQVDNWTAHVVFCWRRLGYYANCTA